MRLRSPKTHMMRDMLLRTLRIRRGFGICRLCISLWNQCAFTLRERANQRGALWRMQQRQPSRTEAKGRERGPASTGSMALDRETVALFEQDPPQLLEAKETRQRRAGLHSEGLIHKGTKRRVCRMTQ